MSQKFSDIVQDWWAFAAFVGAAVLSFWVGRQKDKWEISNLKEDVVELKTEVRSIAKAEHAREVQSSQIAATLAAIAENQSNILKAVNDLQTGKVDK